jgi:hypothetical protein
MPAKDRYKTEKTIEKMQLKFDVRAGEIIG